MKRILLGISLAVLSVAACASVPEPKERVASTQAAIRSAEEVGARHVPAAALHLQLAREQAENARQLVNSSQNERAGYVLMRAESDAELALALARESTLRAEAQQELDKVRALRMQVQPGS